MSDILEVKRIIEEQGHAWEEFKKSNNELIQAKADGKAVADLTAKVETVNAALDKLDDERKKIEDFMVKMTSPGSAAVEDKDAAAELKNFNLIMRSEYQLKGKPIPQMFDQDDYKHYKSGFFKLVAGQNMDNLEPEERKAMQAGSDPDGGYLLPASTVGRTVAKIYEQSTMRRLASVQTISTDAIEGLLDNDEADAGWVSELGTRSNTDTPVLGKWRVEAHEMYAMPKISQKLLDDAATDVEGWLASKVADKFARTEGNAYWNGTGVGQPRGLATYTTAATGDGSRAWGQFEHVKTGTNGDFNATTKADCLHDLVGAFKDQYLTNATWVMRREVRTKLRKLRGATSDLYLWEPSMQMGQPDRLNGYPVVIDQYLPALATDSLSIAFGDFKEAYLIVDRIGIRTLRDQYTSKPYIVFYSTRRTGGAAISYESVKFIKFSA
jgi:HK97 family phage major capsid protein